MRKGSRLTFGHLSYVASYKHPTARKSAAGAAMSWRVRPSVIGVEYALIVVCRVTARFAFTPRPICPATGECVSQPPAPHKRRSEPGRTRLVRYVREIEAVAPSVGIRLIATPVHATAEIERRKTEKAVASDFLKSTASHYSLVDTPKFIPS
jgi:hypothetical protein